MEPYKILYTNKVRKNEWKEKIGVKNRATNRK